MQEDFATQSFLRGYKDKELALMIMTHKLPTLKNAVSQIRAMEWNYAYLHGMSKEIVPKSKLRKVAWLDASEGVESNEECLQVRIDPKVGNGKKPQTNSLESMIQLLTSLMAKTDVMKNDKD